MNQMNQREALEAKVRELTQGIRDYCLAQRAIWQTIPFLALQADGRTGFQDILGRAYQEGYWAVSSSAKNGCYSVYVDLESGRLVRPHNPAQDALDEEVLLITSKLQELDAEEIVDALVKKAAQPIYRFYDEKTQAAMRARMIKLHNITPIYTRTKHFPAHPMPEAEDMVGG